MRSDTVRYRLPEVSGDVVEKIAAERDGIRELRARFREEALRFAEARLHTSTAEIAGQDENSAAA
jgi:hypothetical protein